VIVVLDANTLAPMVLASATGVLGRILAAWRQGLFIVVVSDHLLAEVQRTLTNPYFSGRLTASEAQLYLTFVRILAQHVTITVPVAGVATHPEDDLVLAAALSAGADYLVTGDRRFRTRVPSYQGVTLVSPAEFLIILQRQP
jgi:uncharacterized protein